MPRAAPAKLTDFGVAHLAGEEPLTRTGDVVGTLAYMAPEQAEGRPAGEAADLYSLALVLYEALAGRQPGRARQPAATARRIGTRAAAARAQPPRPSRRALRGDRPRAAPAPEERGTLDDLLRRAGRRAAGRQRRRRDDRARTRSSAACPCCRPRSAGSSRRPRRRAWWRRRCSASRPSRPCRCRSRPLVAAVLVALLPRAGWLVDRAGHGRARRLRPVSAPGRGACSSWSRCSCRRCCCGATAAPGRCPRAAPVLGLIGLRRRLPGARRPGAAAGARAPRSALAGGCWLVLAEPLLDRTLLFGPATGVEPARLLGRRRPASPPATRSRPLVSSGALAIAAAVGAVRRDPAVARARALPRRRRRRARPPGPARWPRPRRRSASGSATASRTPSRAASRSARWRRASWRSRRDWRPRRERPYFSHADRRVRADAGRVAALERAAQPGVKARRPRRGRVLACLQVRGAPGRDRAQAGARDGGAQGPVGVAHLRPQRVRRLALARGPRAVRGLRGRAAPRAVGLPARARAPRAAEPREPSAGRVPHRRAPAPGRVRNPGAPGAPDVHEQSRTGPGRGGPHDGLLVRRAGRRAAARARSAPRHREAADRRAHRAPGLRRRRRWGARATATSCSTTPTSRAATPRSGRRGGSWIVRDLGSTNGVKVNGRRITGAQSLKRGDAIELGTSRVIFELE